MGSPVKRARFGSMSDAIDRMSVEPPPQHVPVVAITTTPLSAAWIPMPANNALSLHVFADAPSRTRHVQTAGLPGPMVCYATEWGASLLAGENLDRLAAELRDAEEKREASFQQQRLLVKLNQAAKFAYLRNDTEAAEKVCTNAGVLRSQ